MELPVVKTKTQYTKYVNILQAELQTATEENGETLLPAQIERLQTKLDALAAKYQDDEELGASRYKLYELQALIYYFQHNDEAALTFIQYAVTAKGESYPKAERLIDKLSLPPERATELTKAEKRTKLIGVEGWLALFSVGLVVTIVVLVIAVLGYGSTFNDIESIRYSAPEMYQSFQAALWFEILYQLAAVILGIYTVIMLAKHRKRAKYTAIIFMLVLSISSVIDYGWVSYLISTYSIDAASSLKDTANGVTRSIVYAVIWIPYFSFSRRVKATLTK